MEGWVTELDVEMARADLKGQASEGFLVNSTGSSCKECAIMSCIITERPGNIVGDEQGFSRVYC